MKLIKPVNSIKKSKRVGRGPGSGLGGTAGRGHKGAGQRCGFKRRYWFEGGQMPLYRRVPMRRFNNSNFQYAECSTCSNRSNLSSNRYIAFP